MFTYMARFDYVHFLHEPLQVHDPGPKLIFMHFRFQPPVSYLGTFAGYCF